MLLVQALQHMFQMQAREVLSRLTLADIRDGKEIDLTHWNRRMVEVLRPLMLRDWQAGMVAAARRIEAQLRRPVKKSFKKGLFSFFFDLFNPKVLDAVDAATMHFCRETNDTVVGELEDGLDKLREGLKLGLQQGDALRTLHGMVREIFVEPSRAFRIAATESKRALEAGEMYSRVESDVVWGSRWEASADACPLCLELDMEERKLGVPFYVDPKGGPYAVVVHPPRH